MRAMFILYANKLQSGFYIFVAKGDILSKDFQAIKKDFYKNLTRSRGLKKNA